MAGGNRCPDTQSFSEVSGKAEQEDIVTSLSGNSVQSFHLPPEQRIFSPALKRAIYTNLH